MSNYKELGRTGLSTECFSRAQFLFASEESLISEGRESFLVWATINGKAHVIARVVSMANNINSDFLSSDNSFAVYPEEKTQLAIWRYCWNPSVSGDKLMSELEWVEENYTKFVNKE